MVTKMRFINYLNERYRYAKEVEQKTINKAKKIIKRNLEEVQKELSMFHFDVTFRKLTMILSSIFMQDKIRIIDDGEMFIDNFKFFKGGDFYKNGDIELFMTEEVLPRLKKLNQEGNFLSMTDPLHKEMVYVLAHMMTDRDKVLRMEDEFSYVGYYPLKKYIIDNIDYYVDQVKSELLDDNFSATKSMIYDLIGRRKEYKQFLDMLN